MRHLVIPIAISSGLVGCGGTASEPPPPPPPADGAPAADAQVADPGDLLAAGSWSCLEGARHDGDRVVIDPIDRWIVGYAPAPATANPPLLLVGPRLEVAGGFRLSMRIS